MSDITDDDIRDLIEGVVEFTQRTLELDIAKDRCCLYLEAMDSENYDAIDELIGALTRDEVADMLFLMTELLLDEGDDE